MDCVTMLSFLLAVLITTNQAGQKYEVLKESQNFNLLLDPSRISTYCLIFRSSSEENLLLWNTSNPSPENFTLPGGLRDRLDLKGEVLKIYDVTHSDSGQYKVECWTDDSVTYQENLILEVCSRVQEMRSTKVYRGPAEIELQCVGAVGRDDVEVQWLYKTMKDKLQPVIMDQSVRVPTEDISTLHIHLTRRNMGGYKCLVLEGQSCVYSLFFKVLMMWDYIHGFDGDEAVLPCFISDHNKTEIWWEENTRRIQPSPSINQSERNITGQVNQMYMEDGRISGNYSLVIPSLTLQHTGSYTCQENDAKYLELYELLVCPRSEPLTEFFSVGEEVALRCDSNLIDWVVWSRNTFQGVEVILDQKWGLMFPIPEDLVGRINMSLPNYFLVLSNLTLEDIGEYWCSVFSGQECVSLTKTVLLKRDPFGINSMFYRVYSSLMTCALLGMVCVLITVNLKTRRRNQVSLKTRRRNQASLKPRRTAAQTQRSSRVEEEREDERQRRV